jgi:metal-responsive CopG/Arc/MetJ family transcriptional regulator
MRKKLTDDEKKVDICVTIDIELSSILDEYLNFNNISNKSKYIENLIRADFIKKYKPIEKKF